MIKYLYIFYLTILVGCASTSSFNAGIGVIDIFGDYPTCQVDLKEIADIEYVPLETTDSSLLTRMCVRYNISDKYIITCGRYTGDIFFFTRSGKFLHKINRQGNGPEEYTGLHNLVIDFETEECLVYDRPRKKVNIYSFEGVYRRSFPWMIANLLPWYNLNKDYLIGYYDSFSYKNQCCEDTHPYYLMSKKDGKLTPLNLTVPNGLSSTLTIIKEKLGPGETLFNRFALPIDPLLTNADEALIAEFSLDTLYSFKEGRLLPLAVKTPSAHSTKPLTVLAPELYTDSFLFFRVVPMYYDKSDHYKPYEEAAKLIWNRKTNQVENWDIYNSDIDGPITRYPLSRSDGFLDKNMGILLYSAETVINLYNEGKLKGKLKDIASKLDEEDNYVLVIAKYK